MIQHIIFAAIAVIGIEESALYSDISADRVDNGVAETGCVSADCKCAVLYDDLRTVCSRNAYIVSAFAAVIVSAGDGKVCALAADAYRYAVGI